MKAVQTRYLGPTNYKGAKGNFTECSSMNPWETPVYRAQCLSWTIAKRLFGVTGDAIRCDIESELQRPNPLFLFRARPEYRTPEAKVLRNTVASEIRQSRNSRAAPQAP